MRKIIYIGNKLAAKGATVTSIETLGEFLRIEGYIVITASDKKNKALRLYDMLRTVFLNSKKTDYVLIDTYSTSNFWYAYLIARLCKILSLKYIPILRGGNLPSRLKKSKSASDSIFKNSFVNVAPSDYLLNEFKKAGYKNLKYIPNSIDLDNYSFKKREIFGPKLLWVRAFSEIYNPFLAIKVLEKLLEIYPEAQLCMVGPEKDASFLKCKKYAEAQELPVIFSGRLQKEEWIKLSSDYDIFLNTTNFDNTPVSLIEAMALGMPIISTNVGGIPFLLENNKEGILVPPNNVDVFVEKINFVINNPEATFKMTENARRKSETFDWKVVKRLWMQIIQ